jgi:ABC-type amino acid transport substrate-binding protein
MRNKCLWVGAVLFLFSGSSLFAASNPKFLTIGTAASGGAYYPIGIAMADIITNKLKIQTTAQITGGAIENNSLIQNKGVDLAISQGVMSYNAVNGLPPYKQKLTDVAGLFNGLSKGVFQLVVNKNSPIKSIRDLKGKKVALGPAGGGAITTFLEVFTSHGFTDKDFSPVYLSYEQAGDSLVDGNLDAILVQAAIPSPAITRDSAGSICPRFFGRAESIRREDIPEPFYSRLRSRLTRHPAKKPYYANGLQNRCHTEGEGVPFRCVSSATRGVMVDDDADPPLHQKGRDKDQQVERRAGPARHRRGKGLGKDGEVHGSGCSQKTEQKPDEGLHPRVADDQ